MPAVVGSNATADFPADERSVRCEQVTIGTLPRRSLNLRHIARFAHMFEEW